MIRENEIFMSVIRDPLFFPFLNRARDPPVRPSSILDISLKLSTVDASFFQQMIVDKKCMKFDYGEAGNRQHYNQVHEVADAFS